MVAVALPVSSLRGRFSGLAYHWQAVMVIVLGSFMVFLNMTIVNVALPRIIQVFQSTVGQGQLVLTGYMLALAVVAPASGYAADTFGAKRTYLTSIGLFTLGTALCGLAPTIEGLILFRVLQGMGGAMILPLGMAILFQIVPPRQRGTVMGVYGFPLLVAPMIGPVLGGYLVDYVDWRLVFAMGAPIGSLAILLGAAVLRETPTRRGGRFDWAGFVLAGIGFSAALLALAWSPTDGWTAPHIVALWLVAAAVIPSFIVVELAQEHPLLDLSVLRNRTYVMATVVGSIATVAMFSSMFLLPLFLQNTRGLGAVDAGLILMTQALAAAMMMPIAGRVLDRFGPKPLVFPGLLALAYATWLLSRLDLDTPDWAIRLVLLLRGFAMGSMMMPVSTVAMDTIPRHLIARATALSNVIRQLCGAFGTGVFASLLLERQQFHQATLAQTLTPGNVAVVQVLSATQRALLEQGLSLPAGETAGLLVLARQVATAATVRGFDDCFYFATFVALIGLVPAIFLKRGHTGGIHR